MSARLFLDSNVMIYAHTDMDIRKQQVAQQIIATQNTVISTQVLQETANILYRKFQFPWSDIQVILSEEVSNNILHTNSDVTISEACRIAERYGFSFYDSLILSAAIESGCERLISEDLQAGQVINGVLVVENPF